MYPRDRIKKTLKRNVVPTFEDMKKPVVESKREPPAARKSLFKEIEKSLQKTSEQQNSSIRDLLHYLS